MYRFTITIIFLFYYWYFVKFHYIRSNNFSSFIKKSIHLVLSKSLLYALIFGRNKHKDLFFSIFIANKIFKFLYTKVNLIGYYCFINTYSVYENKLFMLVKIVLFNFSIIRLYNVFIHFDIQI